MHEFKVKINGEIHTYHNYGDIPAEFDHVISFMPVIPEGPHTDEQHEEIEAWNDKLQRLMEIERASSNKNR